MDANDLSWQLQPQNLPSLLFKPANSTDVEFYDYDREFSVNDLIEFILLNAQNPDTIECYLAENVIRDQTKHQSERSNLYEIVNRRASTLEAQVDTLSQKLIKVESKLTKLDNEYESMSLNLTYRTLKNQIYFNQKYLTCLKKFLNFF